MKRVLILGVLVMVAFSACGWVTSVPPGGEEVNVNGGSYRDITPAQLNTMLKEKDFLLVNVHIPYEGEIPGTDLFAPYNEVEEKLAPSLSDKTTKIVLYCRSGAMSTSAARAMVSLGFTNVWNLAGGMVAWEGQGNKIVYRSP